MNSSKKLKVLVVGATGQQGGIVARLLKSHGHHVKGLTRNIESPKALKLKKLGIEPVKGDFNDLSSMEDAFDEIESLFLMTTPFESGVEKESENGINLIDIAKKKGIQHILFSSVGGAHLNTGIPHFDSKFQVEEHLRNSGVPYSIIRPAYFMENLISPWLSPSIKQGKLAMAMPKDRKLQMVALQNIGEFAVYMLEHSEDTLEKEIDISSDEISPEEAAKILSKRLGIQVDFFSIPDEDAKKQGEDMYLMFKWFKEVGYIADIEKLKEDYESIHLLDFKEWVKMQEW